MLQRLCGLLFLAAFLVACTHFSEKAAVDAPRAHQFSDDVSLLKQHFMPYVLHSESASIAVLPELQGRIVMASLDGNEGQSIGWINRDNLAKGETSHMGGGLDRLWYGPETGPYSVFLPPEAEIGADNLVLQDDMVKNPFNVDSVSDDEIDMSRDIQLVNHAGFVFNAHIRRQVKVLDEAELQQALVIPMPTGIKGVAFQSLNTLTNTSDAQWQKDTGLLSLWSLGMFEPSSEATIIVPLRGKLDKATWYFNDIKDTHTRIIGDTLFYKADAEYMNKTGIPIEHTLPILGYYDPTRSRLVIVKFNFSEDVQGEYVNSTWDWQAPPYEGEAINIFNDGPDDFGNYFGHFFELETSSVALELKPLQQQVHQHQTFVFEGGVDVIKPVINAVFGISIEIVEDAF